MTGRDDSSGRKPSSQRSGRPPRKTNTSRRGPQRDNRRPGPPKGDRRPGRERDDRPERDTSNDLPWPDEIFELELEPDLMKELESYGGRTETLAKHLLSVQVLAEADPEMAYQHAARLRERIPRAALARQTACIAAYRSGRFKEAIKDESAYRRLSGKYDLVPIAADSARGLEDPTRALAVVSEFDGENLDGDTRTELYIVAAGARRDLDDTQAARVFLQKAVRSAKSPMASARARFALGELLAATGDTDEARKWLQSAAEIDEDAIWTEAASALESL